MTFTDNLNNLIEQENEFAERAIEKIRSNGKDFPVVYLPNFMPDQEVDYIFVAMEPSFGKWSSVSQANNLINLGFRNFMLSKEDFLLHFAINNYLSSKYHITDVSKLAMKIKDAGDVRDVMYDHWLPYLESEIDVLSSKSCKIISIGAKPSNELKKIFTTRYIYKIIHFSGAARGAREKYYERNIPRFSQFISEFNKEEVLIFSETFLKKKITNITVQDFIYKSGFMNLVNINDSDLKLLFSYKMEFEKIK